MVIQQSAKTLKQLAQQTKMETLLLEKTPEGVAIVSLNRVDKLNAVNAKMITEIGVLFEQLEDDPDVKCVVLEGKGPIFSAGMDYTFFQLLLDAASDQPDPGRKFWTFYRKYAGWIQETLDSIHRFQKPLISVCHGQALGGVLDLVTCADIRIATSDLITSIKEVKLAVISDLGILQRLQNLVRSESWCRELIFTGRNATAEECVKQGLYSRMYPDKETAFSQAMQMARQIASYSPLVVSAVKDNLTFSRDNGVKKGLQHIQWINSALFQSPDLRNGVQSIITKRPATYAKL